MTDAYTIPLKKIFNNKPRRGRAKKAVREIKEFVKKHKRLNEEQIAISNEVNEKVWARGMFGIPRKIEVQLKEIEGKTFVFLKEGKELKAKEKEAKEQKKEKDQDKKKEEKKTEEEIESEKEKEKKLKEKRQREKDAEKTDIKRKIRE